MKILDFRLSHIGLEIIPEEGKPLYLKEYASGSDAVVFKKNRTIYLVDSKRNTVRYEIKNTRMTHIPYLNFIAEKDGRRLYKMPFLREFRNYRCEGFSKKAQEQYILYKNAFSVSVFPDSKPHGILTKMAEVSDLPDTMKKALGFFVEKLRGKYFNFDDMPSNFSIDSNDNLVFRDCFG